MISPSQGAALVRLARWTIEERLGVTTRALPQPPWMEGSFGGAFVTLRNGPRLRGCIGHIAVTTDLAACVRRAAEGVLHDERFASCPVTAAEAADIRIEISVLSRTWIMRSLEELVPGVHGVVVQRGPHSGCFLPKVAAMQGWDAMRLLAECCVGKAGLNAEAWREPDTRVLLFTAQEFREGEAQGS